MSQDASAEGRVRRIPRPRWVLVAAAVVALATVVAAWFGLGVWSAVVLMVAVVVVTVCGAASAVRRDSVFVAPLAIALVALVNPVVLGGIGAHVQASAGVVTIAPDRGLVLWKNYPGVGGWTIPDDVQAVDTVGFGGQVQRSVRSVVDVMSNEYGWSWTVGEGPAGLTRLANGYGGSSEFFRVDSTPWQSASFDGSPAQRAALLAAAQRTADELALGAAVDADGDVATGDGERTWGDATGTLTLRVEGSDVAVSYVGGPILGGTQAEFELAWEPYRGLAQPPTVETPDLP